MATSFRAVGADGGTPKMIFATTGAVDNYMTFESPVGTDYSVPVGKTFKVTRLFVFAAYGIALGYADDGVADGAAAPTTPVYLIGSATIGVVPVYTAIGPTNGIDIYFEIPADKYPFVRQKTAGTVSTILIGVEE